MRHLKIFESVSVNGCFCGDDGDLSWAYAASGDPEFQRFTAANAARPATMLMGRVTYEMMVSYWPTPAAAQQQPDVARGMNASEKLVLSRSLQKPAWANTRVVSGDVGRVIGDVKRGEGDDIVVLGSGDVCAQLLEAGLVDELELVVKPIALGAGRRLFDGATAQAGLRLTHHQTFADGNVVLRYAAQR